MSAEPDLYEIEIEPEPEPASAAALVEAVAAIAREARLGEARAYASPWRAAALRELHDDRMGAT